MSRNPQQGRCASENPNSCGGLLVKNTDNGEGAEGNEHQHGEEHQQVVGEEHQQRRREHQQRREELAKCLHADFAQIESFR